MDTTQAIQNIIDSVDREEMLNLAQDLIRIPSFKTEESDVARFLGDYLGERGYEVQLQEVEPGRFQTVAILRGTGGGKSLMLNGHIDIDPLAMGWKRDPWTPSIEGDLIYGGGIRNMKAGVSSLVTAAEAIRTSGVSLNGDLVIACVVGELQGGVGTTYLCQNGPLTDMAVVPEPFGADNILTVHAGVVEMAVHVLGNSRHISRKEEAVDAIAKMCKAVPAIDGVEFTYTPREDLPGLPRINGRDLPRDKRRRDHRRTRTRLRRPGLHARSHKWSRSSPTSAPVPHGAPWAQSSYTDDTCPPGCHSYRA